MFDRVLNTSVFFSKHKNQEDAIITFFVLWTIYFLVISSFCIRHNECWLLLKFLIILFYILLSSLKDFE